MRLSKIKLAGFKSFVDPTTLHMRSNLVGIVGPNGCGKSNTIDAVRWVMGESSAKHLRGASMEDVIFNGSNSRKPVGQASIELVFDNSDGKLGGEFAQFSEVSIRRQVSRDGKASYYLNGTKCRRRDITDIFLGTGLGPRSYAIIEQGMISRLIEAKPQELRVYLEEAAGISRYKERRRETENRISHTRDHLERLTDLREEIEKQINHLKRQSDIAEKYTAFKQQEERHGAELIALRIRDVERSALDLDKQLDEASTELEKRLAALRETETGIESYRQERLELTESFNTIQAAFYQLGNDITRTEQSIAHQRELAQRQAREKQDQQNALARIDEHRRNDEERLREINAQLDVRVPELEQQNSADQSARQRLLDAEERQSHWQRQWDDFSQQASAPAQQAQVEKARMEQLERQIAQIAQRMERLKTELGLLEQQDFSEVLEEQAEIILEQEALDAQGQEALEAVLQSIEELTSSGQEMRESQDQRRRQANELRGRLVSLQALQQAAMGKSGGESEKWLLRQGLADRSRLAESLDADVGWEVAVETVLGGFLEAVSVDALDNLEQALSSEEQANLVFFETASSIGLLEENTLANKVKGPRSVISVLSSVFTADSLSEALLARKSLAAHQSIITRDGIWLGAGWLRVSHQQDEKAGVLKRGQEIESIVQQLEILDQQIDTDELHLLEKREQLQTQELRRKELQLSANQTHKSLTEARSRQHALQQKSEQQRTRLLSLTQELEELERTAEGEQMTLAEAVVKRNEALALIENFGRDRDGLQRQRDDVKKSVDDARQELARVQQEVQQISIRIESLKASRVGVEENLSRYQQQFEDAQIRLEELAEAELEQEDASELGLQSRLNGLLEQRLASEKSLEQSRQQVSAAEHQLKALELQRQAREKSIEQQREVMSGLKLSMGEYKVRIQTFEEQLDGTEFFKSELLNTLDDTRSVQDHEQELLRIQQRIARLGPINLAAIDEYKEQLERKTYLDSQNDDLEKALEILENAIAKIDRESRARFKETFEKVNASLQEMFPRLFGGGQAYLELTESDLLSTGVTIMARPPGKRISNIHLMSGGEKALTAVAMVFAIFELNPSPFCMLDEVDAPLDEANVGRFCELVRSMSERVQFIFITHNKTTMELAEQLVGVTMRESGVSRQVDVDLTEAASMATG